jgi:PEP-CTERM motif-containing protein
MRISRLVFVSMASLLLLSGAAFANTCNSFASYNCPAKGGTPNIVHLNGGGSTGQSVGILINSDTFSVTTSNGKGVGDTVIILGAFLNSAPTGTLNGAAFTSSTGAFEGASTGATLNTLKGLGFCPSGCTAANLSYGYVTLGTLSASGLSITASGVPQGTVLYAELVNSDGKIVYITPNSEAGVKDGGVAPVPEPGTLTLMGAGLLGIASQIRRKLRA